MSEQQPLLVLFGGPAGAGKSTLAAAWCAQRGRAAHIQLDEIRSLIVSGLADPRVPSELRDQQFLLSVKACCKLAREFVAEGFDVAIDDVLYPGTAFDESWRRELDGLDWRMVIVQPSLEETLRRSAAREKHVPPSLTEEQHKAIRDWPDWVRVDTTDQAVDESLSVIERVIAQTPPEAV